MPEPYDVVALSSEHVAGAALFADRVDALDVVPSGGRVAEIGVAFGDFTEVMLRRLEPRSFDAFDLFDLHEIDELWGRPMAEWLEGRSHRAHYEARFADAIAAGTFHVHEGDSATEMAVQPDESYDLIYVDGDHHLDGVRRDAEVAVRKVAADGILVFNDYVMADHLVGDRYGVVPVVNDLCVNHGWGVIAFALQRDLFCDIALRRR